MKLLYYPLLLGLAGLASCQEEDPTPQLTASFEQAVTLRYQQSAALPQQSAPELTVTVEDVQDSRCPLNAFCFSAGFAQVKLGLRDQSGVSQTLNLQFVGGPERLDSMAVQANGRLYSVVLRDVMPYPEGSDMPKEDKRVVLAVRRQ